MARKLRVLVAALDWGLGHATRCLPIINELLKQDCEVWLAGHGNSGFLLQESYPSLPYIGINGYNIFYQKANKKLPYSIALQAFKIRKAIYTEHRLVNDLVSNHAIDIVISDNRFGMYNRKAYCIFITHQLHIFSGISRLLDRVLQRFNYNYIQRFDECWVPDFEGKLNLAGTLSHPSRLPPATYYIDPLSRFSKTTTAIQYDLLFILSGPEPLRTEWEQKIMKALLLFRGKALLIRGLPLEERPINQQPSLEIVNHLPATALNKVIAQARWVICRSGYTSIMDLVAMQKKAILVPTPGQAEQEYLATHLMQQGWFYTVPEAQFSLPQTIEAAENFDFKEYTVAPSTGTLTQQVQRTLTKVRSM